MNTDAKIATLRSTARRALEVQDDLANAWKSLTEQELAQAATPDDVELFSQLILKRIYPINAFAALVKVSPLAAQKMLLARYLGKGVDPDLKFGGFLFELSSMLDDFYKAWAEPAMRELILHPQFEEKSLEDPRVIDAFSEALNLKPEEFAAWLKKGK